MLAKQGLGHQLPIGFRVMHVSFEDLGTLLPRSGPPGNELQNLNPQDSSVAPRLGVT